MLYIIVAIGIFLLDFFVKRYVDKTYKLGKQKKGFRNWIVLEKYYNKGAAGNFLETKPGLLKKIQTFLMAVVGIWFYSSMKKQDSFFQKTGIAFLIGGGFSNLFDRYTKGYVVDYMKFSFGPKWFRRLIFNISDFFIFIGAILTVLGQE